MFAKYHDVLNMVIIFKEEFIVHHLNYNFITSGIIVSFCLLDPGISGHMIQTLAKGASERIGHLLRGDDKVYTLGSFYILYLNLTI